MMMMMVVDLLMVVDDVDVVDCDAYDDGVWLGCMNVKMMLFR